MRRLYKQLRKEEKRKAREKGRYIHLNPESQRIARRDKKAFLYEQFKEIEENNRMEKTRKFKKLNFVKFLEDLKSSMELEISREHFK